MDKKREIRTGKGVKITALDSLSYYHFGADTEDNEDINQSIGEFGYIKFQDDTVESGDVNGCQPEDVLRAVLMHLEFNHRKGTPLNRKHKMLMEDIQDMIWFTEMYETKEEEKKDEQRQRSIQWSLKNREAALWGKSVVGITKGVQQDANAHWSGVVDKVNAQKKDHIGYGRSDSKLMNKLREDEAQAEIQFNKDIVGAYAHEGDVPGDGKDKINVYSVPCMNTWKDIDRAKERTDKAEKTDYLKTWVGFDLGELRERVKAKKTE